MIRRIRAIAAGMCLLSGAAFAADGHVSGTATYRERLILPGGTVFEAVLQDVSRADAPAVDLGRITITDPMGPPYIFAIPFEKTAIDDRHVYAIRAMLWLDGELLFTTDTFHPVLTRGAPDSVEMMLVKAGGTVAAAEPELRPRARARIVPVAGEEVPADVPAPPPLLRGFVVFEAEGAQFSDCATGRVLPLTKNGDFAALEHAYVAAGHEPGGPVLASFEGEVVDTDEDDDIDPVVHVRRFVGVWPDKSCEPEQGDRPLVETRWEIIQLGELGLDAEGEQAMPFLHLQAAGNGPRFSASVGCNTLAGSFELDGDKLRFGHAMTTLMACPEAQATAEAALGKVLEAARGWRIAVDRLELVDEDGMVLAALMAAPME